jgi:hypothetical protein
MTPSSASEAMTPVSHGPVGSALAGHLAYVCAAGQRHVHTSERPSSMGRGGRARSCRPVPPAAHPRSHAQLTSKGAKPSRPQCLKVKAYQVHTRPPQQSSRHGAPGYRREAPTTGRRVGSARAAYWRPRRARWWHSAEKPAHGHRRGESVISRPRRARPDAALSDTSPRPIPAPSLRSVRLAASATLLPKAGPSSRGRPPSPCRSALACTPASPG